jgi:uncharacterized protein
VTRALSLFLLASLAGFASRVEAQIPIPKLEARVTDLTGTLTAAQQSALEEKLASFEARKGSQIAVLMLPTTAPEDIATFGYRLAESWKIGRQGTNDGAILIIAKDDRAMRIEVGRGLEGALPDALAGRIVYDTIAPLFKQGEFYGGVNAGVDQMIRVIDGEALPAPDNRWRSSRSRSGFPWTPLILVFLFFTGVFGQVFGRIGGASVSGVLGALLIWWFTAKLLFAFAGLIGMFLLGLLFGGGGSSYGGGRSSRWISGGGWTGGSGGGFGGGGFSGGGGSFGGGGASGRW